MKKLPSISHAFVALCLALGTLPAAAQMNMRVAGSNIAVPVVPAISGSILPTVGTLSPSLTPIGLNGALAAPSPLVSVVPTAAVPVPSALTVVTPEAAVTPEKASVVRTPGAVATHIAKEVAAYTEVSGALTKKEVAGSILDTLSARPAAAVSFDGAAKKSDLVAMRTAPSGTESKVSPVAFAQANLATGVEVTQLMTGRGGIDLLKNKQKLAEYKVGEFKGDKIRGGQLTNTVYKVPLPGADDRPEQHIIVRVAFVKPNDTIGYKYVDVGAMATGGPNI